MAATRIFTAGTGDCYATGGSDSFDDANAILGIGNASAGDWPMKAWVPFTVDLPNATLIESAYLRFTSAASESGTVVNVKIGCEAADNPAIPTSYADLFGRTLSTAYTTDDNVAAWTAGSAYSWDISTAVQEILNRPGWATGQRLAVFIVDNNSDNNAGRQMASANGTVYAVPTLEINYFGSQQVIMF